MQESDTKCFRRVELLTGYKITTRVALADRRHDIWTDHRRDNAKTDFGQTKCRVTRADGDVACSYEADAAAAHGSMHTGNRWFAERIERMEDLRRCERGLAILLAREAGALAHMADIGTC